MYIALAGTGTGLWSINYFTNLKDWSNTRQCVNSTKEAKSQFIIISLRCQLANDRLKMSQKYQEVGIILSMTFHKSSTKMSSTGWYSIDLSMSYHVLSTKAVTFGRDFVVILSITFCNIFNLSQWQNVGFVGCNFPGIKRHF